MGQPVFVDETGRRSRWARRIGVALVLVVVAYVVLLGASLTKAPWVPKVAFRRLLPQTKPSVPPSIPDAIVQPVPSLPATRAVGALRTTTTRRRVTTTSRRRGTTTTTKRAIPPGQARKASTTSPGIPTTRGLSPGKARRTTTDPSSTATTTSSGKGSGKGNSRK